MSDVTEQVMQTPVGAALGAAAAQGLVKQAHLRTLERGAYLFRAGDPGDALYLVLRGAFEVVLGKRGLSETVVATLGAGQLVGELELMTGTPRVASLLATEPCMLFELSRQKLEALVAANDVGANKLMVIIAKSLARRLAAVNERILAKAPPPPPLADMGVPEDMPAEEVEVGELIVEDADLDVLDKLWT